MFQQLQRTCIAQVTIESIDVCHLVIGLPIGCVDFTEALVLYHANTVCGNPYLYLLLSVCAKHSISAIQYWPSYCTQASAYIAIVPSRLLRNNFDKLELIQAKFYSKRKIDSSVKHSSLGVHGARRENG